MKAKINGALLWRCVLAVLLAAVMLLASFPGLI